MNIVIESYINQNNISIHVLFNLVHFTSVGENKPEVYCKMQTFVLITWNKNIAILLCNGHFIKLSIHIVTSVKQFVTQQGVGSTTLRPLPHSDDIHDLFRWLISNILIRDI